MNKIIRISIAAITVVAIIVALLLVAYVAEVRNVYAEHRTQPDSTGLNRTFQPFEKFEQLKAAKKETTHERMKRWNKKFQKLSDKQRKEFIRYWIRYYQKRLGYKNSDLPRKAVTIARHETSLGHAGVGRNHKKNLFGLKRDDRGKYRADYRQRSYRLGCKALVRYYADGLRWSPWERL